MQHMPSRQEKKVLRTLQLCLPRPASRSYHAANHRTVLERLGQKVEAVKPEFTVKTTRENLEDAVKGESYEITTMYPGFIATAKEEGVNDGAKSMRWAMDTEKTIILLLYITRR